VLGEDDTVSLMVVNISETQDIRAAVRGIKAPASGFLVTGADLKAANVEGEDGVVMKEIRWEGGESEGDDEVLFPKHSIMMLRRSTTKVSLRSGPRTGGS